MLAWRYKNGVEAAGVDGSSYRQRCVIVLDSRSRFVAVVVDKVTVRCTRRSGPIGVNFNRHEALFNR